MEAANVPFPPSSEGISPLLLLIAGVVALIGLVVIFTLYKRCRFCSLAALILVLGYLAYVGHRESVHRFANETVKPLMADVANSNTVREIHRSMKDAVNSLGDTSAEGTLTNP